MDANDMGDALERILISEQQIADKLQEMATQIDRDYRGREILLVGVLKGATMVMADLARLIHTPLEIDWMAVSSYGASTKSSGVVRILKDLDSDLGGRDVLIVEDVIDSGLTLDWAHPQPFFAGRGLGRNCCPAAQTGGGESCS